MAVPHRPYSRQAVVAAFVALLLAGCARWPADIRSPMLESGPRVLDFDHDIDVFTTDNGIVVAMIPVHNANVARVDVRYRVGAADDPTGHTGVAHLVEHMQFALRANADEPTISDRLEEAALDFNAYTNWDETHYMATALHDRLPELLSIEADRLRWGCDALDPALFEREQAVVRQEIAERSTVSADVDAELRRAVFGASHPYARPIGGTDDEVANATREQVCGFVSDNYVPDRAIIVVSGRFDPVATRERIVALFGAIPASAGADPAPVAATHLAGTTSRHQADVEEATAVVLFESPVWGGAETTRANFAGKLLAPRLEELQNREDIITDITVTHVGGFRGGAYGLAISVTDESEMPRAVDALFDHLDDAFDDFDDFDFAIARGRHRADIVRSHEPFAQRAMSAADYLQYTRHGHFMMRDLSLTQTMSPDDLRDYAAEVLQRKSSHIAYITPGDTGSARSVRVELPAGGKGFDVGHWVADVDPAEADQPVALTDQRPRVATRELILANGARVVLASGFDYPVVDVRVVFPAGDEHDPADKTGVAMLTSYLLEHDLSLPYRSSDYDAIREVFAMGGSIMSRTTDTATVFRNAGLSIYADGLIWQLHWRLESGHYDSDDLARLKKLARRVRKRDSARAESRFAAAFRASLYGESHPYAVRPDVIDAIAGVSENDLKRFRAEHYRLNGATIIVAGQFDESKVEAQLRRLYGAWDDAPIDHDPPALPAPSQARGPTALAFADADSRRPSITLAYRSAAGFTTDYAARLVLEEIVRQRMVAIREKLGVTYGIAVTREIHVGPGYLSIEGTVDPGSAVAALEAMRDTIADLRAGVGLREDFVRARRAVLETVLASSVDSRTVANELEKTARYDLAPDFWERLPERVATLTPDAVGALIATDLAADREVIVVRSTDARARSILSGAGFDEFAVID